MRLQRLDSIEEYIYQQKSISLNDLCEHFQVSKNTIRRDIDALVQKGKVQKVYGGVTVAGNEGKRPLIPFEERHSKNEIEKARIAKRAAACVAENDLIYIDSGTTCTGMVDYLAGRKCTILTNSLEVLVKAVSYPELTVFSLPGKLKRETLSVVGNEVIEYLQAYNIRKAFMACTGITIKKGLTNATMEEHVVKKAILENSQQAYALADHTKFGEVSILTYAPLSGIDCLITDHAPAEEYIRFCKEHKVEIVLASQ